MKGGAKSEVVCASCGARNRVPVDASGTPRCGKCKADLPWLADVDAESFDAVIASSSLPILVDLWAPWCGPCRSMAPILAELAIERAGSLRVVKVNVDEAPAVSSRLGVQGIPTMLLFNRKKEVGRQVGAVPAVQIRHWIDSSLSS